jgi:glycosyltransferase involved in cell wall biosynthesis
MDMPIITTNHAPMNEYVQDNFNGLLIKCSTDSKRANGITIANVDIDDFSQKISLMSDRSQISKMSNNIKNYKKIHYNWNNTRLDYLNLINMV